MIYIPANNNLCGALTGVPVTYTAGKRFAGTQCGGPVRRAGRRSHRRGAGVERRHRRARVEARLRDGPNWGSMLRPPGGWCFTGGTSDRKIHAFDAASGKLLWEFATNSGIVAPPTTFAIDGKQYLAVLTGWGGDAAG